MNARQLINHYKSQANTSATILSHRLDQVAKELARGGGFIFPKAEMITMIEIMAKIEALERVVEENASNDKE